MTSTTERTCPVATDESACPVSSEGQVNPRNFMPTLTQSPFSTQKIKLPVNRTTSTIPKSDEDESIAQSKLWEYPSPQQFFNAVMRKGFTNTQEIDVPAMVSIHNAVNERAWSEILQWETKLSNSCGGPKLVKFRGDATVLTPKARFLGFLGYSRPFDTHFWTIDRCGEKVDYVIDFYKGKQHSTDEKLAMPSFYLDVRPAGIQGFPTRLRRAMGL